MRDWSMSLRAIRSALMVLVVGVGLVGPATRSLRAETAAPLYFFYLPYTRSDLIYTVYQNRTSWQNAVGGAEFTEDFESDPLHYDEVFYPYQTGNGFIITGDFYSSASIVDFDLLHTGKYLHTRAWFTGLSFQFPNAVTVRGFGFDYRPSELWYLKMGDAMVRLPTGSETLFYGLVFSGTNIDAFTLVSLLHAQGGLSLDNLSYLPTSQQ